MVNVHTQELISVWFLLVFGNLSGVDGCAYAKSKLFLALVANMWARKMDLI